MTRSRLVFPGLSLALGLLIVTVSTPASLAADPGQRLGHDVRFDLIQIIQNTFLAGGTNTATDARTGEVISLTGSGGLKPATREAAGGGTFTRGTLGLHGVWVVTGFVDWQPGGGMFPGGFIDGIGAADDASAGIATLNVRLFPTAGAPQDAILEVHCTLPGATIQTEEGVVLKVGTFDFTQSGGFTLIHVED